MQAGKFIEASQIYNKNDISHPYPCYGGNGLRGYVSSYNRYGSFPIIGRQGALCGNVNFTQGYFYATEHAVVVDTFTYTDEVWATYFLIQLNLNQYATATAQPGLSVKKISEVLMPLPPFQEQKRIVAEIEKWFSFIDNIKDETKELELLIKKTKSKILDLAISGKLVPQDPNDEPASELLKRINPKAEITSDNGHYEKLPGSWCVAPMGMLCSLSDGEKQTGVERINLDVKYLRGEHVSKTLTSGKFTPANSLLILVDGENSGEVFRTPIEGYQGSTFKRLSIKDDMNTDYVLKVINLHRKTLRENKVGSAIPHLNKKLFKEIEVPIPPYNEQKRIVENINITFKLLDTIMESL